MNAVEIEEAVSKLEKAGFDAVEKRREYIALIFWSKKCL
jgi:hypothetical protein